jgi:hypothetical protein
MLEKLIVGRAIVPPGAVNLTPVTPQNFPNGFQLYNPPNFYLKTSEKRHVPGQAHKLRVSDAVQVNQPRTSKPHRNFRWLPYMQGEVACVRLAGSDILTGPMSGCPISIFRCQGGLYVAHIGTVSSAVDPQTIAVKQSWNGALAAHAIQPLHTYDPFGQVDARINQLVPTGVPVVWCGVEATGSCYAILLSVETHSLGELEIAAVERCTRQTSSFIP